MSQWVKRDRKDIRIGLPKIQVCSKVDIGMLCSSHRSAYKDVYLLLSLLTPKITHHVIWDTSPATCLPPLDLLDSSKVLHLTRE